MASWRKVIPADSLLQLRQRLDRLPPKSPERAAQIASVADLYGVQPPLFSNVMRDLHIDWQTHTPAGKDGTRTTARAKGKVERPFRAVKEAHETLYHFHKPETEHQANEWLWCYLTQYNNQRHRSEKHSRIEDWVANLPPEGVRDMCTWEQYRRFAREPESRKVGGDARVTVDGTVYEVEPDMAGETVILQWGLFDDEMFVEFDHEAWGPYFPVSGPVPLHRYRTFRRGKTAERSDRIHSLAVQLNVPISALSGSDLHLINNPQSVDELKHQPFDTTESEYVFPTVIAAKLAIADDLATPLAKLSDDNRAFIDGVLTQTLIRREVLARIREHFRNRLSGADHAG